MDWRITPVDLKPDRKCFGRHRAQRQAEDRVANAREHRNGSRPGIRLTIADTGSGIPALKLSTNR
jgi:hypothetical protein